jgi:hypothetical protein
MVLIKKQIFRPSKDENLQQFFAKEHGENMEMRWGQPSSKDKPNTQARKKGLVRGVPEKAGDAAKKVTPKKAEPKSPWDDESDALDQGSDNSNSADDTTGKQIKLAVQDAWFEKQESHLKRGKDETDKEWWERLQEEEEMKDEERWDKQADEIDQREEQEREKESSPKPHRVPSDPISGQDQPGEVEDREIRNAVQDAWFEKAGKEGSGDTVADREHRSRMNIWWQGHPKGFAQPKHGESYADWETRSQVDDSAKKPESQE